MNLCVAGFQALIEKSLRTLEEMAKLANVTAIVPTQVKTKQSTSSARETNVKIVRVDESPLRSAPLVGGLFTDFMPTLYSKIERMEVDVLYSLSEEWQLSTFYNSLIAKSLGIKHAFYAWWIPRSSKKALLYALREGMGLRGYPLRDLVLRLNTKLSDGVIACNTIVKEDLEKLGAKKVLVSPQPGVDTKLFNPKVPGTYREKLGLSDKIIILFTGGFRYHKGPHFLLNSARHVVKEEKNVHFILCGAGKLEEELKKQVQTSGLKDFVTFLKYMPYTEIPFLNASADIIVCPSLPTPIWEEGFGYVNAEAHACGKPVVATMSGAIHEIVIDGETGLLVPPNDEKALAAALLTLIRDEELRKKMGGKGMKRVEEHFSNEAVARKTIDFFKSLLED